MKLQVYLIHFHFFIAKDIGLKTDKKIDNTDKNGEAHLTNRVTYVNTNA